MGICTVTEYRSVCYFTVKAVLLCRSLEASLGHRASSNLVCKTSKLFNASDVLVVLLGMMLIRFESPSEGDG